MIEFECEEIIYKRGNLGIKTVFRSNGNCEISIIDSETKSDFTVFNFPVEKAIARQVLIAIELAYSRGRISIIKDDK